jgi:excinuclease ABC subunit A
VATATEVYDYLRLLFARIGETWCTECGARVEHDTIDYIAVRTLALPAGARFHVLFRAPLPFPADKRRNKAAVLAGMKEALTTLRQRGFNRLYQPGTNGAAGRVFELSTPESLLDLDLHRPVYVLVDRLAVPAAGDDPTAFRSRLVDSIELSYREGSGEAFIELAGDAPASERWLRFSERFECRRCGATYAAPEPALFSFNSPYGACPRCHGFGNTIDFDLDKVIPDKSRPLSDGAIDPWSKPRYRHLLGELRRFCRREGIDPDAPWARLSARERKKIIEGDDDFPGLKGYFAWLERKKYKLHVRVFLSRYRGYALCPQCEGARLRKEARAVRLPAHAGEDNGRSLPEVVAMSIAEARRFFDALQLTATQAAIADKVLEELRHRLRYLDEVGLSYLTLDRLTSTLAGGEAQRIQLASSIGSRLVGALYVLDEPSIGLHPRDTHRLIEILQSLRELGNTILVVEHDPDIIRAADRVLDLGPGAGEHGGRVVFAGSLKELARASDSLTGRYLAGELRVPLPAARRRPGREWLRFQGCSANNLKGIDIEIPLGLMVAVTGVSGSGKSSLVHEVIYKTLEARQNGKADAAASCARVEGADHVGGVVLVDQSPIGRTPRSNPVTYLKAFDAIRELLAVTPEAKKRGYAPGHFSFNVPGGRCETCQGDGTVTVEMQFLADVELQCEDCKGARFKPGVLEVRYKDRNVHEILELTVREALGFFAGAPKVGRRLKLLDEVGLGYLRLGQSATTLSGGEAQRVKLAAHLVRGDGGDEDEAAPRRLYIFDEPTTGLHFDDIQKLLTAFRKLLEGGASVLIIEHNLEVIKTADWVIDLGPEGGEAGGTVVAAGTPEQVARSAGSHTGQFLGRVLNHNHRNRAK